MLDKLLSSLPPVQENQFTYFDIGQAFEVTINQIQPNSSLPLHVHEVDVFNLVLEGEITFSVDGKDSSYRANEWCHIRANQTHAVRTTSPVTLLEFWQKPVSKTKFL